MADPLNPSADALDINTTNAAATHHHIDEKAQPVVYVDEKAGAVTTTAEEEILDDADRLFALNVVEDDSQPPTSRLELWSYYFYYGGDNGVGPLSYSPFIPQFLATNAGWDPSRPGKQPCDVSTTSCVVAWGGGTKQVNSVQLIGNGLALLFQAIIFIFMGSLADFGQNAKWILWAFTVLNWGVTFGAVPLRHPHQWHIAFGLNMLNVISYGATLVFYAAIFPRLAAHQPNIRQARQDRDNGLITEDEYQEKLKFEQSHVSSISTTWSNIGFIIVSVLNLAAIIPMGNTTFSNNVSLAVTQGVWVVMAIPWLLFEKRRPGPKLPKGENYFTIGLKQVFFAVKEVRKIPQTFLFLISYFVLCDGLNTTGTMIGLASNDINDFDVEINTLLNLSQAFASVAGTLGFWYIQKYFKLKSMTMFQISNFFTWLMPLYGTIGIWTHKVGIHNKWELWMYNVYFGLFQAPFYAYAQTCMADLTPPGYENMFFGLYGIMNKSSSWIGPFITSAINDRANNNWAGFPFVFGLCLLAWGMLFFVKPEKGHLDALEYSRIKKEAKLRKALGPKLANELI